MLHLQENVALARKCCICKKMLQLQENLAFSGKKMLHLQENFLQMQHFLAIFLHLQENFLQMQHFLATKSKILLQLQHFLANATFSCQCNIFLQMQHFLATKCKGARRFQAPYGNISSLLLYLHMQYTYVCISMHNPTIKIGRHKLRGEMAHKWYLSLMHGSTKINPYIRST